MRMTAAVMYEQGLPTPYARSLPFRIEDVDLTGPDEGEVLVEVSAAGLCHSDLSQVAGLRKRTLPVVGGHEGAGIVREVGPGVTQPKPGDHVVMTVATGCGYCRYCTNTKPALCEGVSASRSQGILPNGLRKLSRGHNPVYHYSGISSFAQYAVTVPSALIKIDPAVPLDVAAMFGCAVVTGAGAVFNPASTGSTAARSSVSSCCPTAEAAVGDLAGQFPLNTEDHAMAAAEADNVVSKGDRVRGKVAIVTGAGSSAEGIGNGRAAALALARHGARVGLLDFHEAAAAETARMIDADGGESIVIQADVTDVNACEAAVRKTLERWGRLDILVNNVGTSRIRGNAVDVDLDAWDRGMQTNVKSMVMMVRFAVPEMQRSGGGSIINIASITERAARVGSDGTTTRKSSP